MIDNAITSLLKQYADRVYPSTEIVKVTSGLPKVIYSQIDGERRYCDAGDINLTQAIFQLDIFGEYPSAARSLAKTIREGLDGYSGTVDSTRIKRIYFPNGERFERGERAEGENKTVARFIQQMTVEYRD